MAEIFNSLVKSRRFWAAAASIAVIVLKDKLPFPVSDDQITQFVMAIGAWVVGESLRSSQAKVESNAA